MPRRAFTIVELMIVVAIIMVLAALAVPQIYYAQIRAKRAEAAVNVDGIKMAEAAYEGSYDSYLTVACCTPVTSAAIVNAKGLYPWVLGTNFDALGWRPDGNVRATYAVIAGATNFHNIMGGTPNSCPDYPGAEVCPMSLNNIDQDAAGSSCISLAYAVVTKDAGILNPLYLENWGCI